MGKLLPSGLSLVPAALVAAHRNAPMARRSGGAIALYQPWQASSNWPFPGATRERIDGRPCRRGSDGRHLLVHPLALEGRDERGGDDAVAAVVGVEAVGLNVGRPQEAKDIGYLSAVADRYRPDQVVQP